MKNRNKPIPDRRYITPIGIARLIAVLVIIALCSGSSLPVHPAARELRNTPQIEKIRRVYTSQIGIREKENNTGKEIEKYLRYVGLPEGNPWCAAFVCWVLGQANIDNPRTGWSPSLFPDSKIIWDKREHLNKGKISYRRQEAACRRIRTGDVFGIFFPEKKRIAHVGFIDYRDDTWLITVEGNTYLPGSSGEEGVYMKRRLLSSIYKVARYTTSPEERP